MEIPGFDTGDFLNEKVHLIIIDIHGIFFVISIQDFFAAELFEQLEQELC